MGGNMGNSNGAAQAKQSWNDQFEAFMHTPNSVAQHKDSDDK